MNEPLEHRAIGCPYCGESFELVIDHSAGAQEYIEDCHVCCRPVVIELVFDPDGSLGELRVKREDD